MRALLLTVAVFGTISCSTQSPHSNPYDPASPPAAQAKAALTGSISLESSTPEAAPALAGIKVAILGTGLSADTDATGAYQIADVTAGSYSLQATKAGYQSAIIPGVVVRLEDGGGTVEVPAVTLPIARGTVTGKVALEGETSSAGASISLAGFDGAVLTDQAGAYTILGVPEGSYSLTASKVAFVFASAAGVQVIGGQTTRVADLTLAAQPGSISGTVLVRGAASSAGVSVIAAGATLGGNHHVANGTSDDQGRFTLSSVPAGTYQVTLALQDYVTQAQSVAVSPGSDAALAPTTLVRESGSVVGNARLQGSTDSSGIQVVLTPLPTAADANPDAAGAALTDSSGSWRLDALPVGQYDLAYSKEPGYHAATGAVTIVKEAMVAASPVELAAIPGLVTGTVTLEGVAAGGDLSGTTVRIEATSLSTSTLADGTFALFGVGAGAQTVVFERTGFATDRVQAALAPGQTVALLPLQLSISRGALHGTLIVEERSDASGVRVALAGTSFGALTDASGAFRISGVSIGTYTLTGTLADYSPLPGVTAVVTALGDTEAPPSSGPAAARTLTLLRTASIAGAAIYDPAASDQLGTGATLTGADVNGVAVSASAASAASGEFVFDGLAAGVYRVTLSRSGFEPVDLGLVPVASGSAVQLPAASLQLSRGSIAGQFQLGGAADSSGVVVAIRGTSFAAVTTATGAFSLDGVPVGSGYVLDARKAPDWNATAISSLTVSRNAVTVIPGSPVTLTPVKTASIAGTATLEGATAGGSAGTFVTLSGIDFLGTSVSLTSTTGSAGGYSFANLVAGNYTLSFAHAGYDAGSGVAATVSAGASATAGSVTLAVSRGALGGTVTSTGASDPSGTTVLVSGPDTATAVTSASGAYTVPGLRVGAYNVTATRPGYASSAPVAATVSAGTTAAVAGLTITPAATASISGTATLERSGTDQSGIRVSYAGTDLNGVAVGAVDVATTDTAGAYAIPGLKQGTYLLTFAKARYDGATVSGLFAAAGASVTARPVLLTVSLGSIAGSVTLASGIPGFSVGADSSGVTVALSGVDVPIASAVTDTSGGYRFDRVPVTLDGSSFTLHASKPSFGPASTTVLGLANATATASAMSMTIAGGTLTGTASVNDNVGGAGPLAGGSAGVTVAVTGTAFNGNSYSTSSSTDPSGAWSIGPLPPGSYGAIATSTNRTCAGYPITTVPTGGAGVAGTIVCTDAVAPGALALGLPNVPAAAQPGFTTGTSVSVPIAAPASDLTEPSSNLRGYQTTTGDAPDWTSASLTAGQPGALVYDGLAANARTLLWARAIDWAGNAGPATGAAITTDGLPPPAPTINTPRAIVNATTTSVTLSGSESDANFYGYQRCTTTLDATAACPATAGCVFAPTAASFAVSLEANRLTCLYAQGVDRAGRSSEPALAPLLSDLIAPSPPTFTPGYDPTLMTVRAPWVDFFTGTAATDQPGAGGPWQGVAWVEVDTGAGFQALCPQAACSASGAWNPCGCGCADTRLLCDAGTFVGVRATLAQGTSTSVSFRAVDVAGNTGPGVSQQVLAEATSDLLTPSAGASADPAMRGSLVAYALAPYASTGAAEGWLVDLGPTRRVSSTSPRCRVAAQINDNNQRGPVPVSERLVTWIDGYQVQIRRPGPDGIWCNDDDVTTTVRGPVSNTTFYSAAGSGETLVWTETSGSPATTILVVDEPGADGLAGTADDQNATLGTFDGVGYVTMSGSTILAMITSCPGGSCATAWRVFNANASGSFRSGVTSADLTTATNYVAGAVSLSNDGRTLAWVEGDQLVIHQPGPSGRFDAAGDVVARLTAPVSLAYAHVAVDGPNLAALTLNFSPYWLLHWSAGPDGRWGTADDTLDKSRPTGIARLLPAMADGLLTFVSSFEILDLDLTTRRWEVANGKTPTSGWFPLSQNGAGTLFYKATTALVARTASGSETSLDIGAIFASDPSQLIATNSNQRQLVVHQPDASGTYFTASAPQPVQLYSTTNTLGPIGLGGGKLISSEYTATGTDYRIFEPGTGSLRDGPPGFNPWPGAASTTVYPMITARQAFFDCAGNAQICVYGAGPDGLFGTGDDTGVPPTASYLVHPPGTPQAGQRFHNATIVVSDTRMLIDESYPAPGTLTLLDAGADGLFGTSDDQERTLAALSLDRHQMALAGDQVAYLDVGGSGGMQIFLVNGFDGLPHLVTNYFSPKRDLTVDPSGRIYWIDGVFTPEGIMVRAP